MTVVTDNGEDFPQNTGHGDTDYYGGYLIAESILKTADARLIAAAPDLLAACESFENIQSGIPGDNWVKVYNAIKKARG